MLKDWNFVSVDAKGRSRGLLLGWRTRNFHLLEMHGLCVLACVLFCILLSFRWIYVL